MAAAGTSMSVPRILVALATLLTLLHVTDARSKAVTINLHTKWSSTPLILETSEFLAKESNDLFWKFVNAMGDLDPKSYVDLPEEAMYELALKHAEPLLTPLQLSLLKFSLSLRVHSPAIQMYQQMGQEKVPLSSCEVFVDVNNMVTCEQGAVAAFLSVAADRAKPTLIKNDHHFPGTKDYPVTVVLYAQLGTQAFHDWHNMLRKKAEAGDINYILRHFIKNPSDRKVQLSGYGVELAIKSTEYKAKDDTKVQGQTGGTDAEEDKEDEVQGFMFNKLKELHPDKKDNLNELRQHLIDSTHEMAPLKVWQLQDLSYQAAQRVLSAPKEDALRILRDISQNFPSQARSLVKTPVKDELREEMKSNQKVFESSFSISAGESVMFINGLQADLDIYDVFTLLETLKNEAKLMEGLHAIGKQYGVEAGKMSELLRLDLRESDTKYAVDIRDPAVVYVNDLEKDRKYAGWPSSLQDLLRPTFPGMMRHIRKNLFYLVFIVDPADKKYMDLLKMAEAFLVHNAPVRVGLVFDVNKDLQVDGTQDAGVAMMQAFNFIIKEHNRMKALSFLTDIYETTEGDDITAELVMQELAEMYQQNLNSVFGPDSEFDNLRQVYDGIEYDELSPSRVISLFDEKYPDRAAPNVFGVGSEYDSREDTIDFLDRVGLGEAPQVLVNGVPMSQNDLSPDNFEEAVVTGILHATPDLQRAVYNGFLSDGMDILEYLMTRIHVMPRLNPRILAASDHILDLSLQTAKDLTKDFGKFRALPQSEMSSAMSQTMKYLSKKEDSSVHAVSLWIVADLETPEGRGLAYEAVKHMKHTSDVRLGFVHNPTTAEDKTPHFIARAIQVAMETLTPSISRSFVTKLLKEENVEALKTGEKTLEDLAVNKMDIADYLKNLESQTNVFLQVHRLFADEILDMEPGARAVITNGKVLGPLRSDEKFIQEDFSLLEKYTSKTSAGKIEKKIKDFGLDSGSGSEFILQVSSLLLSVPQKESRKDIPYYDDAHSVLTIPASADGPAYDVVAILDPTTRAAQKYTPLLMVLQEVANVNIQVFMNCREKLSEMPLKSFYRYVLEPEVTFSDQSQLILGPYARFQDMPEKPILTLGMDPPEGWLVESVRTPYDLDNIHMEELDGNVHADFELEYLLLEGHCYDTASGQPPRGLQFILGTNSTPAMVDTIVMANLGYFQLKATAGAWLLQLRPGRSNDIYQITSHEYTDSPSDSPEVIVVIDSFKSKIIRLRVGKKSGKDQEDLLSEDTEENKGLWDSISSKLTGRGGTAVEDDQDQTLNIFSVASGHLYERFLRIMMVSVLRNTQSKVKFWFLKNFLSPTFKDFIPHLAKEYGFEYELVQYKWPRWLHQQTEKQRIIWGYKILFLDVLFPLNINKIIFVDADQIVRADLQELHDLDLEGAPYGYTPFCDSRKEMDGFRFWKSGYWASHLGHRKYHISALYVVDLKKFRKIAAGDRLRGQYQGLSQDPNSLSNLDQDLPNNMIHQVNIKSLPQEWLWCETWCSDSELATAKTIDMCNNPKTKEPKLQLAMRIAPEWREYDSEIKTVWDRVYDNKSSSSRTDSSDSKDDSKRDEL